MEINRKIIESAFVKIQEALTKEERAEFNKIRCKIFNGLDCFNESFSNLSPLEKEGIEQITYALHLIGSFHYSDDGEPEVWWF